MVYKPTYNWGAHPVVVCRIYPAICGLFLPLTSWDAHPSLNPKLKKHIPKIFPDHGGMALDQNPLNIIEPILFVPKWWFSSSQKMEILTTESAPSRLRFRRHGHNGDCTYLRVFWRSGCSVGCWAVSQVLCCYPGNWLNHSDPNYELLCGHSLVRWVTVFEWDLVNT